MDKIGEYNERLIFYQQIRNPDWETGLPDNTWLVILVGHNKDYDLIRKISGICLDKNVHYLCALGEACKFIHDIFDETIYEKRIEKGLSIEKPDDFIEEPMTTWHDEFNEGVWFALTCAYHEYFAINNVVCLDLNPEGEKDRLINVIQMIQSGWLPD